MYPLSVKYPFMAILLTAKIIATVFKNDFAALIISNKGFLDFILNLCHFSCPCVWTMDDLPGRMGHSLFTFYKNIPRTWSPGWRQMAAKFREKQRRGIPMTDMPPINRVISLASPFTAVIRYSIPPYRARYFMKFLQSSGSKLSGSPASLIRQTMHRL